MALSDLDLLELVEKAQERQKGERGEPGVGIATIEQFDDESLTIRLTDGFSKKISLPKGNDGAVGPAGIQGPPGERGADGRPGRDGISGRDGKDGVPGPSGVSVDTAIVNSNGHLLLGLTDGSIADVGRVVGPAGPTGERGGTGLAGEPGKDGAAVLSGPRAPGPDDGIEGDHWIDISSTEFAFYKKSGTGWTLLANLRAPQKDPRVGIGGAGGSSGGGSSQTSGTLPLANPTRLGEQTKGLPDTSGLKTQADFNSWTVGALESLSAGVSPDVDLSGYATEDYVREVIEGDHTLLKCLRLDAPEGTGPVQYEGTTMHPSSIQTRTSVEEQLKPYAKTADLAGYAPASSIAALEERIAKLESDLETLAELIPPVDMGTATIVSVGGNDLEPGNSWLPQNETGAYQCVLDGSNIHGCRYSWEITRGQARFSGDTHLSTVVVICTDPAPNMVNIRCTVSHPTTDDVVHGEMTILVQESD